MAKNVHLVFSLPPAGVSEDVFTRWYETTVEEILAVPGFASARRYWLKAAVGDRSPTMFRHLAVYQLKDDVAGPLAEVRRRRRSGEMHVEPGFDEIHFSSIHGTPLEEPDIVLPDHAYLVFSRPPDQISAKDYSDWYAVHMRENLTADGFTTTWRFSLEPDTVDPQAPSSAVHAALYAVDRDLAALRASLAEARDAGHVSFPDWFGEIEFAPMDCTAASPAAGATVRG